MTFKKRNSLIACSSEHTAIAEHGVRIRTKRGSFRMPPAMRVQGDVLYVLQSIALHMYIFCGTVFTVLDSRDFLW